MRNLAPNYIINELRKKELYCFTPKLLAGVFNISINDSYNVIKRLKRREFIFETEKGTYFVLGLEPEKILSNPYFIANKIASPSYISFWSALHFYGFTEQVPRIIFVATTIRKNSLKSKGYKFKYVKIGSFKFFGYEKIFIENLPVLIAEKEKAVIDSISLPSYAGGIGETVKCLQNALLEKSIDITKLKRYALRMKNKTLISRLGYILDALKINAAGMEKYISKSFVLLSPDHPKTKKWDKKWKVNVNISVKDILSERIM